MDLSGQTFIRGAELKNGRFIIGTQDPGLDIQTQPHTGYAYWTKDEGWMEIGLAGTLTVDMTENETADYILSTDPTGFITEADGDSVKKEYIKDSEGNPLPGLIRCVRRVGEEIFAGGVERKVFKRSNTTEWQRISTDEMESSKAPAAIQGIDGFGPNEIYSAGWEGEIWSYEGTEWTLRETPTDIILNDICAGDDKCVAVGLAGHVLVGRHNEWRQVKSPTRDDFWSVRFFKGAFYLSTISGIYKFEDDELTLFRDLDDDMRTSFVLNVGPSGLWSVGNKDVVLFDGENWQTIGQA